MRKQEMEIQAAYLKKLEANAKKRGFPPPGQYSTVEDVHKKRKQLEEKGLYAFALAAATCSSNKK